MFKSLVLAVSLFSAAAFSAPKADSTLIGQLFLSQHQSILEQARTMGLNWSVGDQNDYKMSGGIINGTNVVYVKEKTPEGNFWLVQDMNMGFMGKQLAEILIDANTGAILKMIVNGQEQQVPEQEIEVISMTEDRITVPAGTFDAIHIIAKEKKQNTDINQWVNPKEIPINGMLKSISPTPIGMKITMELTKFVKK